eukprot:s111_g34.t1
MGSEHHQVVWLATFSDGKRSASDHRTKHKWVNKEAEAEPFVHDSLARIKAETNVAYCTHICGHEIVGLALLSPWAQHQALLPLDDEMRAQHSFWCLLSGSSLDGQLFYFKALKAEATRFGVPLAQTHTGRTTCFFHLDRVWAERSFTPGILGITEERIRRWKLHTNGTTPTLTLRLPKPVAFLVINQQWSMIAVPDSLKQINLNAGWGSVHVIGRDTAHELRLLKQALDRTVQFPIANALDNAKPQEFDVASLPGRRALQELLQETASFLLQGRPLTDETRLELQVKMMSAAQALQDSEMMENIFRQESMFLQKSRKYSAIRLLDYFWVSGALMNDRDLRDTLKQACLVSMPTQAAKHAVAFIDGTEHDRMRVPSQATLSRVRARLDTAWMLYFRKHMLMPKLMVSDGAGVRVFVQTDATWQARQEYQVTVLNLVDCGDLLALHKDCCAHGFGLGYSSNIVPESWSVHVSAYFSDFIF